MVTVILNAFYTCPAGNQIALEVDALNDAPETIRQPTDRTLFAACWGCEGGVREPVVIASQIKEVGYCELKLGKITE